MAKLELNQPVSIKVVLVVLVGLVVVLALAAGYYEAALRAAEKKYLRLEDKYIRVQNQLGKDTLQDLIQKSYEE